VATCYVDYEIELQRKVLYRMPSPELIPSDQDLHARLKQDGITVVDLGFLGTNQVIAAWLIESGTQLTLIETGPTTTLPALKRGIANAGYDLGDVTRIIVTHIHLDHSGAAGVILNDHPGVRVAVHPVGAPHLVDPERLLRSASRIYRDDMERLWGQIIGVPEEQVDLLHDGESLRVGNRTFTVAFTPGHASHHVVVFDEQSGTLFTGDIGGVRIPGSDYVAAPIPPPELDPLAWEASIARLRSFGARRLALTHFGVFEDVDAHLDQVIPRIQELVALGEAAGPEIADTTAMAARFDAFQRRKLGDQATETMMQRLNLANPDRLAAMGMERYLRKRDDSAGEWAS
jgi:glyoxylase-like metal-dependent hydrolase (beta-lactamase superfamily II)